MKAWLWALAGVLGALAAICIFAHGVDDAATGSVASTRCFTIRTANTAPTCSTGWTMDAGSCLTFYFDTTRGASPSTWCERAARREAAA